MSGNPSVAAQVAVVCDTADASGAPLGAVVAYAAAVWRATGTVPAHYAAAVAAAEVEIGADNTAAVRPPELEPKPPSTRRVPADVLRGWRAYRHSSATSLVRLDALAGEIPT